MSPSERCAIPSWLAAEPAISQKLRTNPYGRLARPPVQSRIGVEAMASSGAGHDERDGVGRQPVVQALA